MKTESLLRTTHFIIFHAKKYQRYILGLLLAVSVIALDATFKNFLIKTLIDTLLGQTQHSVWLLCVGYASLQIILIAAWALSDYCINRYTVPFRMDIIEFFMHRLYEYHYGFFNSKLSGTLNAKIDDACQLIPSLITTVLHEFISFLCMISISIVFLAQIQPLCALATLVWVMLFLMATCACMRRSIEVTKQYAEQKSKLLGNNNDYLTNIMSVKTFVSKALELDSFYAYKKELLAINDVGDFYFMRFYMGQGIFTSIYSLAFIIYLIVSYQKLGLSSGDFAFMVMVNFTIISTVFQLPHKIKQFVISWGAVDQALSMLQEKPHILDNPDTQLLHVSKAIIEFDNVSFCYQSHNPLFKHLNVIIQSGQKVGLVGFSGGGKSTFINLILRFYKTSSGRILIDNQNIDLVTQDSLRSAIGLIPQDPPLFHRSIMENIRYGTPSASDQEVIKAARAADIDTFIQTLPEAYDSIIGKHGLKFSGGQRQRIAIARAILKNAPILIMDEATSQLDSETERVIQNNLQNYMKNKTALVIAHRLSTLIGMDRILVFEHGRIVQDATHAELIVQEGLYKVLWQTQNGQV